MLTQVDITRFSTYRWGLEAGIQQTRAEFESVLNAKEAALTEKEQALQTEKQRINQAVKQLLTLNTMSHQAIADLFQLSLADVEAIAKPDDTAAPH